MYSLSFYLEIENEKYYTLVVVNTIWAGSILYFSIGQWRFLLHFAIPRTFEPDTSCDYVQVSYSNKING